MERRTFIQTAGLTGVGLAALGLSARADNNKPRLPSHTYPNPMDLHACKSLDGLHMLRITVRSKDQLNGDALASAITVEGGAVLERRRYMPFHTPAVAGAHGNPPAPDWTAEERLLHVVAVWVRDADETTRVRIQFPGENLSASFAQIFEAKTLSAGNDTHTVTFNFLLDHEIRTIEPAEAGIRKTGSSFTFLATADPQGGNPAEQNKPQPRMEIHNAFIKATVRLANGLKADPAFTVVIGDVTDGWGLEQDFLEMNAYLGELKTPVLYTIGNHETRLRSQFEPGYNMEEFSNYFAAQKAMNGLELLLYSFNLGDWHFIFWPDPLRTNFWETHPHYFDWLERDLEANKHRPTMIFQHVPVHPIGIDPMISYCEPPITKRTFLNIAAKHGNVKYIFSGHVHIPVKASFKTAVTYGGITLINLPAAGYRPRAFGEPDICDGPCQGVAIVEVKGKEAQVTYKVVTEDEYPYPQSFPEFDTTANALWLSAKHELPAVAGFVNGDFRNGLNGWSSFWVHKEDKDPSNICEVRPDPESTDRATLFLFNRKRGYETPGQDRLPQSINQIAQAVSIRKGARPAIKLRYRVDSALSDLSDLCGGYIWIEGFDGPYKKTNMVYAVGKLDYNFADQHSDNTSERLLPLRLTAEPDRWHSLTIHPAHEHDLHKQTNQLLWDQMHLDRLVVTFGVWTVNQNTMAPFGWYIADCTLEPQADGPSRIDGQPVAYMDNEHIWWRNKYTPNSNLAGEHRYHLPMETRF